jgi:sulfatase modifying factor 1
MNPDAVTAAMAWVPGGRFLMGSDDFYPEEGPMRRIEVDGFWMDPHPVTVADFRRFAAETGYDRRRAPAGSPAVPRR